MKKFLISLMIAGLLMFGGNAMADGGCNGGDCVPTVNADIEGEVGIHGGVTADGSDSWAGGQGTADVTLNADAAATGMDTVKRVRVRDTEPSGSLWQKQHGTWSTPCYRRPCVKPFDWHPQPQDQNEWTFKGYKYGYHWETVIVPGESEAFGRNTLTLSSEVDVHTNEPQTDGLSYTSVEATTTLDIDGVAWAEGTNGCPQTASIDVEGSISAYAYGNSFSGDLGGAFASAGGSGMTTVSFIGSENDASTYGGWFSPNKAYVDFNSTITVEQELFTASYVSDDGTTAANFAFVGGGSAQSDLGSDGSFFGFVYDRDDIQLTGIQATGQVSQSGIAIDGGSYAAGSSQAFFSGAYGSIETIPGAWCQASPGQTANVGGHAVVTGYNNVSVLPSSITVTSIQHAHATTGNSGPVMVDVR